MILILFKQQNWQMAVRLANQNNQTSIFPFDLLSSQ